MEKTYKFTKGELENLESDTVKMYQIVKSITEYVFARLGQNVKFEDMRVIADFHSYKLCISVLEPRDDFFSIGARELVEWNWQKSIEDQFLWYGPLSDAEFPEKPCEFDWDNVDRHIVNTRQTLEFKTEVWEYIVDSGDGLYDEICFAFQEENIGLGEVKVIDGDLCVEVTSEMGDHLDWIVFPAESLKGDDWKQSVIEAVQRMLNY